MQLCSQAVLNRRRKRLKRSGMDGSLTAAGSQRRRWMGRPGGAGWHRFTQGDRVGEVSPQERVLGETGSRRWRGERWGGGVREGRNENKRQTQETVIQVDISMRDASRETGCHRHMMTKLSINTLSVIWHKTGKVKM